MTVMDKELLDAIGDADELERQLAEFRESAQVLSSRQRHLIARYPKQWIAIYSGEVAASAQTLPELLKETEAKGIPRGRAIIRYIDNTPRKLFL